MSGDEWITLGVLVGMLVTLAADRFPPAGVVFGATFALLLSDVIDAATDRRGLTVLVGTTVMASLVG